MEKKRAWECFRDIFAEHIKEEKLKFSNLDDLEKMEELNKRLEEEYNKEEAEFFKKNNITRKELESLGCKDIPFAKYLQATMFSIDILEKLRNEGRLTYLENDD